MALVWRKLWIGFFCFTAIGLIFSAQFCLYLAAFGKPVRWGQCLLWMLGSWYLWAALCPLIFWLSKRLPLTRTHWLPTLVMHGAMGVAVSSVHVVTYSTWTWLV